MRTARVLALAGVVLVCAAGCVGYIRPLPGADGGGFDTSTVDSVGPRPDAPVGNDGNGDSGGMCPAGQVACSGRCVDTTSDATNCGACGMACAAGMSCTAGACVPMCASGQQLCGTPPACVTVASDPMNCGTCGHACPAGQTCSAGACGTTCMGTMCGAACVDLATNPSNCGMCGHACPAGQSCVASACQLVCPAGQTACAGACVNTATDGNNCGACGRVCGAGMACSASRCACAGGLTACGTTCVNTATDAANCGACGRACSAGQACMAGTCMGATCVAPMTMCGASCVNTATDTANCGMCGHACAAGQTCSAGTCMGGTVCPGPPAGVSANAAAALMLENSVRSAMGIGCATMVTAANTGADRHCAYYAADRAMSTCVSNPHVEVSTCPMFNAANFWERMTMAGYTGSPAFEDMAFLNNGMGAVQTWIDSIWHRTPVLDPWVRDIGYGSATGCDTMDFGTGAAASANIVATYPYANQTGVPTSFDGRFEGPMPPAPPTGWPSGYPVHIYIRGGSITSHSFTVDGSSTVIDGVWLTPSDPRAMGLINDAYVFYANAPLTAGTRYRFQASGTNGAGAVTLNWVFTTR